MVHIFTPVITARTQYVLRVIFKDHLQAPYQVSQDLDAWKRAEGVKINYSSQSLPGSLQIPPSGILEETYVKGRMPTADPLQNIDLQSLTTIQGIHPGLIPTPPNAYPGEILPPEWPFDLFGAVFYLLSRYEEYLPGAVFDALDRFEYTSSWAYRQGCLDRPLVDEWIEAFREYWLEPAGAADRPGLPGELPPKRGQSFVFGPTYDIDLAWCYRHKGLFRTLLSLGNNILRGNVRQLVERWKVWTYKLPDPFNNYDWMDELHESHPLVPVYFFPAGRALNAYDRNHSPRNKAYKALIRRHAARYLVGIHPSFYSSDRPGRLKKEKARLSAITGRPVNISRFHFIRFQLPGSYQLLLENDITADYSMGYGNINGFRASYSRPFPWYDLEKERETSLQVVPFCFMEATSYYEQQQTPQATREELEKYLHALRAVNGRLTTIWHNSSLNESPHWIGWRSIYNDLFHKVHPPTLSL